MCEKTKAIMEKVKEFMEKDWTMAEKILLLADVVLAGILLGWLTSPFKGGFFSNNIIESNNENYLCEDDNDEE